MKFRVGACALLVCLAGCSEQSSTAKFGETRSAAAASAQRGKPALKAPSARKATGSVANAPDRGALVAYENNSVPSKTTGAYTWYPVAISEQHALKAVVTGEMTVPSPDGSQVKLRYERHTEHPDGNWTWVGRVEGGDQKQEAILTFGEKAVYGSIPQPNGAPALSLETRNGALWAVKTDPSKVVSATKGTVDTMIPPTLALRSSAASTIKQQSAATQAQAIAVGAPATSANTIDVAIGYTQGFASAQGGSSAAVTRLNFLIEVGNQAFTNSQINGYLRLVSAVQVSYADNTANGGALEQVTGNTGNSPIAVPAGLAPLRTARDQYGADLAVLMRDFRTPENAGCGVAWLNGAGNEEIIPSADDDFGFAVVSDGYDTGTDNKEYFCPPETLVHELGHLMGSAHDRDNAKDPSGAPQPGRYPYSYGMKTTAAAGNFYTIMAYGSDNQNFYRTFSNPAVVKCGPSNNLPCGTADTDNARSLNQTIPVVATFRNAIVPFASNTLDLTAIAKRGGSTTTELHTLSNAASFASYTRHIATALPQSGADKSWNFQFGDYNRDGVSDFYAIKKTGQSGATEIHILNGSSGFKAFLLQATTGLASVGANNSWIFKLGDENGDSRLDLYAIKRNGSSLRTEIHVLNGADGFKTFISQKATALENTGSNNAWEFELGDYNGDGKLDVYVIKKVASSGATELHVLNGANGYQSFLAHIATGLGQAGDSNAWNFKVGDYNRDGILDLYCIKRVGQSGTTELHVLDGFSGFKTYTAHVATALGPVGDNSEWEFELTPGN